MLGTVHGEAATHVGRDVKEFTSFPVDATAEGPASNGARMFKVIDAGGGVLEVTTEHGARQLTASAYTQWTPCAIYSVTGNTTVGRIALLW